MSKYIRQGNVLPLFFIVILNCLTALVANAANPASKDYVDAHVNRINTEITQMESKLVAIPAGGTTGQVLKKVSNSNYDTQWLSGGGLFKIGQHIGADVIYYVYKDAGGIVQALVSAPEDESSCPIGNPGYPCGFNWAAAVAQCAGKTNGGYTWFLPDRGQMTPLFVNRFAIAQNDPGNNGGFQFDNYWSLTEFDGGNSMAQFFSDGNMLQQNKNSSFSVRCVRALPL